MKYEAIAWMTWLWIATMSMAVCSCGCPPCPEVECPPCAAGAGGVSYNSLKWTVERVIDGDTVVLVSARAPEPEKVRMLQINTPERNKRGYAEATGALAELLRDQTVRLEFVQPGVAKRDRFGRLLAYLFVGEMNVNIEMVRLGWSKYWTKYGRGRFPEAFEQAEVEAKSAARGLWNL